MNIIAFIVRIWMIIAGGMLILVAVKCLFSIEKINRIFSDYANDDYNYFITFLILFILGVPLLIAGINSLLLSKKKKNDETEV